MMSTIVLQGVSFAYIDHTPILTDLTFEIPSGWTGIVGPNGTGKSTLLRLITGDLCPSAGRLRFLPEDPCLRFCPQTVEEITPDVWALGYATDRVSRRLLGQLKLTPDDLSRWETLSPGERKRWQIGAALAAEPSVLLLDEPTNHLDADARELLLSALLQFPGTGLVVSHDRTLLDRITTRTIRFDEQGSVKLYRGSYSVAKETWEAEAAEIKNAYLAHRQEEAKVRKLLAQKRQERAAAERERSTRKRMKNSRDHDARDMLRKGKAEMGERRLARDVTVVRRQLERIEAKIKEFHFQKAPGRSVFVDYERAKAPCLMALDAPALTAGETVLLREARISFHRDSRVWLAGPNGSGKSTLVRALLAGARIPEEKILYLPQEIEAQKGAELLDAVRALPELERGRVLSLVAALGVEPERLLASASPSPGEARKLMIAYGLGRHVWCLILDEPTNHMDLPSVERLEEALCAYPGALLLVSHDERFATRCASTLWQIREQLVWVRSLEEEDARP